MLLPLRATILALAALTAGAPALAAPAPATAAADPMAPVFACADVTDSAARLACFDKEVAALRDKQTKGSFAAIDPAVVETMKKESFGFSIPSLPKLRLPSLRASEDLKAQAMTIERVAGTSEAPLFIMTNGQKWRQNDTDSNRAIRPGVEVTIEKAALGSFLMSSKKGGASLRVRREE